MFSCPHCRTHLQRVAGPQGVVWRCSSCEGRAVGLGVLRRILQPGAVNAIWQTARAATSHGVDCPMCHNPTKLSARLLPAEAEGRVDVDVCTSCPAVWFDPHELELLGSHEAIRPPPVPPPLPPKVRELLALAEIEAIRQRAGAEDEKYGLPPDEGWKAVLTVFGIPVEEDDPGISRWPWVTWATVLLMALGTFWAWWGGAQVVRDWGLLSTDLWRSGGLTFVTAFFLHAGFVHLFGNAAFLLVFGDNTEDYLGHWRYAVLLLGAALTGDLLHLQFEGRTDLPMVGASGGISGVIAFYVLQFPRARLVTALRFGPMIRWVRFSAITGFLLWIGLQAVGIILQTGGLSAVSSLAHTGGAAFGALFWLATRKNWRRLGVGLH